MTSKLLCCFLKWAALSRDAHSRRKLSDTFHKRHYMLRTRSLLDAFLKTWRQSISCRKTAAVAIALRMRSQQACKQVFVTWKEALCRRAASIRYRKAARAGLSRWLAADLLTRISCTLHGWHGITLAAARRKRKEQEKLVEARGRFETAQEKKLQGELDQTRATSRHAWHVAEIAVGTLIAQSQHGHALSGKRAASKDSHMNGMGKDIINYISMNRDVSPGHHPDPSYQCETYARVVGLVRAANSKRCIKNAFDRWLQQALVPTRW